MTNHEVYLRARLADEEKPLNPGMKAAIEWALEEIATWRGMWDVANKRANEYRASLAARENVVDDLVKVLGECGQCSAKAKAVLLRALEHGKEGGAECADSK